jgi:hypothetical protein
VLSRQAHGGRTPFVTSKSRRSDNSGTRLHSGARRQISHPLAFLASRNEASLFSHALITRGELNEQTVVDGEKSGGHRPVAGPSLCSGAYMDTAAAPHIREVQRVHDEENRLLEDSLPENCLLVQRPASQI